jgi:HD superfamily phosphohydrolase|tara:strand:- start:21782 stop:23008 length:1227 start_codon:yes stop_codon:yes gene_type:complete
MEKYKIINDPIYGFIKIESKIIYDLINHKYFQRLRRISQLGLSYLVYPGAQHTRFQHALGSLHLMDKAIQQLTNKGHEITSTEQEALRICILLHDIGHGPFSHALEKILVNEINHEQLTLMFMKHLNEEFNGKLSISIEIFKNTYKKKFLHQLVSSQLDMDRLDYLKRDSFFTGVTDGNIGTERIINMLNVADGNLVIEEKGIYSIEKFILARRLMYWQVYLHKTVISSENMLMKLIKRAKFLISNGEEIFITSNLLYFLNDDFLEDLNRGQKRIIEQFAQLDDYDIYFCLKKWQNNSDKILSLLSKNLLNRNINKIIIETKKIDSEKIINIKNKVSQEFQLNNSEVEFLVINDQVSNHVYNEDNSNINILMKNNEIVDLAEASDHFNIKALNNKTKKYFISYPKLTS